MNDPAMPLVNRLTPMQYFRIEKVRWKNRTVGLANHRIGTHNKVDVVQRAKDGKRYYPDTYYIGKQQIEEGVRSGKYEIDNQKGVNLIIIPIEDMTLLSDMEE